MRPELRDWQRELVGIPADLAEGLADPIRRLSALIGALPGHPESGVGEPDGFDGLTRRGTWDRLLLSEWLLADVIPDEFLRRASERELAYLRPRRVDPATSERSVVLFDCGPDQLGAPRIAHFVALVVLAGRCRRAAAGFAWAALHDDQLYEDVGAAALLRLRSRRTVQCADTASVDGWRARLDGDLGSGEPGSGVTGSGERELWLVGGASLRDIASSASRIIIEESLQPGERLLQIEVRVGTGCVRLELPLPNPRACVRLLRNPLDAPPVRLSAGPGDGPWLAFDAKGDRLFSRHGGVTITAAHVPNSARARPGADRTWTTDAPILAVGYRERRVFGLTLDSDHIMSSTNQRWGRPADLLAGDAPYVCLRGVYKGRNGVFFVDTEGTVWLLTSGPDRSCTPILRDVANLSHRRAVRVISSGIQVIQLDTGAVEDHAMDAPVRAVLAGGSSFAVQQSRRNWVMVRPGVRKMVVLPDGAWAVGVVHLLRRGLGIACVLKQTPGQVVVVGDGWQERVVTSDSPVVAACASMGTRVAVRFADRSVVVRDVDRGEDVLLRAPAAQ